MDARLGRQVLRYSPQNKIHYLCGIAMNLHTFSMYSNILYFAVKSLILLFISHVSLCPF